KFPVPDESEKPATDFRGHGAPRAMDEFMRDVGGCKPQEQTHAEEAAQPMPAAGVGLVFKQGPFQTLVQKFSEVQEIMSGKLPEQDKIGKEQQRQVGKEKGMEQPGVPVAWLIQIRWQHGVTQHSDHDGK